MRIGGKGRLKAAEDYFIPKAEAEEIIKSVKEALKDCKKVAKRLGAQERDIKPIFTLSLVHENGRLVVSMHGRPFDIFIYYCTAVRYKKIQMADLSLSCMVGHLAW